MAKESAVKKEEVKPTSEALAVKPNQAIALMNFQDDAGAGQEGADKESFAIPFLLMLQPMSPVVVDELVPGAKAGMIMNTVTNTLYKTAEIIPVAFSRRFLQWAPRDAKDGGFKGIHQVSDMEKMRADGVVKQNDDGLLVNKEGHFYRDTRQHYVLIREGDVWTQAMLSMTSTQIKRSKRLMTIIGSYKLSGAGGGMFNPPSFARYFSAISEKETNEKGTWYSWLINPIGLVEDPNVYAEAKLFHKMMVEGKVKVDYEKAEGDDGVSKGDGF